MKKIFAIAAVAAAMLIAGKANAQLNVHGAYAPQTYKTTGGISDDTWEMNGFFGGVDYNMPLMGNLHVDAGLNLRYNTSKETSGVSVASLTTTRSQILVDIPVLLNYGLELKRDIRIAPFVGPTFSFALSGKTEYEGNLAGITGGTEGDWYGDNAIRNRLDISATFGLSIDFRDFRIFGGYNLGLLDLDKSDNTTTKGTNWFVGLGYNL